MGRPPDLFALLSADPAVAPLIASPAPAFVFADGGRRLVWANVAGAGLFGARRPSDLARLAFPAEAPAQRRLAALAASLSPGEAHVESLRFFRAVGATDLACRIAPLDIGGLRYLLAVAPGQARPAEADAARQAYATFTNGDGLAPEPSSSETRPALGRATQWVFALDAAGRFEFAAPELARVLSPEETVSGATWGELAERAGLHEQRIDAVIEAGASFSGLSLAWPVPGGDPVKIVISGVPVHSRDGVLTGFRGFAVTGPAPNLTATPESRSDPAPSRSPRDDVVRLPGAIDSDPPARLTPPEQDAFRQIAEALGARMEDDPFDAPAENAPAAGIMSAGLAAAAALVDRLPVALVLLRGGVLVYASRGFLDLVGAASEAAVHRAGGLEQLMGNDAAGATLRRLDGAVLAVRPTLHPVALDGATLSMLVFATTAPRSGAAEERLSELEAILDTATDGVLVLDARGRIASANRSVEALLGHDRADLVGRLFTSLFAPESQRAALDYFADLAREDVRSVLNDGREVIGAVRQGGYLPLFMTMGRLGSAGERFCAILRDVAPWKRAEEELIAARRTAEAASAQKSDFLARISHEIRTPLNAILGFAEVLMDDRLSAVGAERRREYLRDIHVSGTHIMSLVNDLLDLSKIEAGKMDLAFEPVSVNELVRDCVALMQPQANRERVIIRTSFAAGLPRILADARSLTQITLNLLSNAIKFTPAGGQVIVSTQREDSGEITLRVRDTGIGMSRDDLSKAMEPFRQLGTARAGEGTGLGLPLTKAMVEANRASFRIESAVGQGTLAQVIFPAARVAAE